MIKEAIALLVSGKSLSEDEAAGVMTEIMEGTATPAQVGAFITALRIKGETVQEITGLARTMRAKSVKVAVSGPVVDTCGTGGDGSGTFNISTATAFVAAAALKVAKHGNRAMSSQCGSADVLEALGVRIELNAEQVKKCLDTTSFGFMFAPAFHPAMKFTAAPRREIGIRTVFNILGPLTNPAGASAQVLGVAEEGMLDKMASVLGSLGCKHALVVHGNDGLDEITISDSSRIAELKNGSIKRYTVSPEEFSIKRTSLSSLKGGTAQDNAATLRRIFAKEPGPARDIVLLNAAAVFLAGDRVPTLKEGVRLAGELIDSGQAQAKLEQVIKVSQSI